MATVGARLVDPLGDDHYCLVMCVCFRPAASAQD